MFRQIAWEPLIHAALARFFLSNKWLAFGPVQFLATHLILKFANEFYASLSKIIDLEVIAFRNETFKLTFERSSVELKIIAHGYGVDSPEFLEVRKARKDALKDIARIEFNRSV